MWGGLLGGLASGLFGYKGTKEQNVASAQQAQNQMAIPRKECLILQYKDAWPT